MNNRKPPRAHPVRHAIAIFFGVVLVLVILLFAYIGVLTLLRDPTSTTVRALDASGPPATEDAHFASTIALETRTALVPGNTIDLLVSGVGTYPVLWQTMRSAKKTLTVQLYYMATGKQYDTLVVVLKDRARAGVKTYMLYDAFGASLPDTSLDQLRAAGVHVAAFRPVKWWTLHKAQNRSHVRAVVADGLVGITGGFGIDDKWSGDGRHKDQWRDTSVRIHGPAVGELQAAFARAWNEATGNLLVGDALFPALDSTSHTTNDSTNVPPTRVALSGLAESVVSFGPSVNARMFALSVAAARHTLFITNAYFVPDPSMLAGLEAAAKRGVDVKLLLPGTETDVPSTRYAAQSWYERLIEHGIKIYEYQPSMLHSKTFVVDGMFSSVGSMNLDFRSFALNDEANLLVLDRSFGARMDSLFNEDLKYSRPVDLAQFKKRGFLRKIRERYYRAIGRAL